MERARLEKLEAEPRRSDDILKTETTVAPTEADVHAGLWTGCPSETVPV